MGKPTTTVATPKTTTAAATATTTATATTSQVTVKTTTSTKKRTAPKGKKYILKRKKIRRKVLETKTTVSLDFTDEKNKDKKEKFERVYRKRAKAKSATFVYKKKMKKHDDSRRQLASSDTPPSEGTEITAILRYESDLAVEAGKTAVIAENFSNELRDDMKKEGVPIFPAILVTSANILTVEEEVVEEVLVNDITQSTIATAPDELLILNVGTSMLSNTCIIFANTLIAILASFY